MAFSRNKYLDYADQRGQYDSLITPAKPAVIKPIPAKAIPANPSRTFSIADFGRYNQTASQSNSWADDAAIQYKSYLAGQYGNDAATAKQFGFSKPLAGTEKTTWSNAVTNQGNWYAKQQVYDQAVGDAEGGMLGYGPVVDALAIAATVYFAGPALMSAFSTPAVTVATVGEAAAADLIAFESASALVPSFAAEAATAAAAATAGTGATSAAIP